MPLGKLFGNKQAARMGAGTGTSIRISNPWHAVSIQAGGGGCAAARALGGVRYLSADAPGLPLKACSNPGGCRCTYRHHDDRRAGPRRAIERGSPLRGGSLFPGDERRHGGGRRRTD
jgi:hypothetical protein